jgi:hypothetical protein
MDIASGVPVEVKDFLGKAAEERRPLVRGHYAFVRKITELNALQDS